MTCNLRISFKRIRVTTAIILAMLLAVGLSFASLPVQAGFAPDLQDRYWNGDVNPENKLDDLIDGMAPYDRVDIIVLYGPDVMREGCDLSDEAEFLSAYGEVEYVAKYVHAIFVNNVSVGAVKDEILPSPNIFRIEKQPIFEFALDKSARAVKARSSTTYPANTAWALGLRGSGINIAIIDSGVDDDHESLAGKFVAGYNAVTEKEENPDDDIGHGTHCAGIAMGTGGPGPEDERLYMGVAPDAKLIDIKVNIGRRLDPDAVYRGIEWAIAKRVKDWEDQPPEHYGIDVLSISIWYRGRSSNGNSAIDLLIDEAVSAGLVVVAIAGNGGEVNYIGPIGAADRAITVGAVDDRNTVHRSFAGWANFQRWGSQTGPRVDDRDADHFDEMKPDVVAPGVLIHSAQGDTVSGYHDKSGTSMACPHVAGIAALILQYCEDEDIGRYTPDMVKTFLRDTAEDRPPGDSFVEDPTWDKYYGKGIVDAYEAIPLPITDLGFLPGSCPECGQTGRRVCWPGTNVIRCRNMEPVVGHDNTIYAKVTNYGEEDAEEATVIFSYARTGIGVWVFHEIARKTIGPITKNGGTKRAEVEWIPQFPEDGGPIEHGCIRAEVVYQLDDNLENNVCQINVDVTQTGSPAELNFMVVNPFAEAKDIDLIVDKTYLPPDWKTELSSDRGIFPPTNATASCSMGEACPEYVTLTITPREDAYYGETGSVTVKMYIDDNFIGQQTLMAVVPQPVPQVGLTVFSTAGGSVTTPGEGTFTYDLGNEVILIAQAEEGYHFVGWIGAVDTIADPYADSTTITMEGDYEIAAVFWEGDPCFIATAAYGTPMAEEIEILREFRDEYLLTNPLGQALVDLYYRVSPPMAEFIAEHPSLKQIVRAGLVPAVAMAIVAVNTTLAEKIAIVGLLALVSVAVAVWATRRRGREPQYTRS